MRHGSGQMPKGWSLSWWLVAVPLLRRPLRRKSGDPDIEAACVVSLHAKVLLFKAEISPSAQERLPVGDQMREIPQFTDGFLLRLGGLVGILGIIPKLHRMSDLSLVG